MSSPYMMAVSRKGWTLFGGARAHGRSSHVLEWVPRPRSTRNVKGVATAPDDRRPIAHDERVRTQVQ